MAIEGKKKEIQLLVIDANFVATKLADVVTQNDFCHVNLKTLSTS